MRLQLIDSFITFVKCVVGSEEVVSEPDFGVGVKEVAVVVVRNSASVLNVGDHVPDRRPRRALDGGKKK